MADPQTPNIGLAVPTRGSDVGTWDLPVNGDMSAIDGLFGGVLALTLAAAPITLTTPAGLAPAPTPGPVQSQNAVIKLTGAQSANVTITLPVPGFYIIDNQVSTSGFLAGFVSAAGSGGGNKYVQVPQGMVTHIYNDGTNVEFVNLGAPGHLEFFGGDQVLPDWVLFSNPNPYLLANGAIYNIADFPFLGRKYGNKFGGNGSTTFGVQDLQGRVPLAYDGTGARVTAAGSGINGQLMGSAGGLQSQFAAQGQLPNVTLSFSGSANVTSTRSDIALLPSGWQSNSSGGGSFSYFTAPPGGNFTGAVNSSGSAFGATSSLNSGVAQQLLLNMQPSQVAGIWAVKT